MAQSNTLEYILKLRDQASKELQGFAKNVEGVTKGLNKTGLALTTLGAGATAALGLATKASMDFDSQLRNIQSISKATEGEIQSLGNEFIKLSKQLPQTASQLAEGFYNIQGSGFEGAEAMKVLDAASRAASAGLTTTESSAYAITSALNAYGREADDARAVSDVLFKTVDVGVISFEELAGTIGQTLGTASSMGVSIEELGASISTMTKKGIGGAEATTALNASIMAFMKPSETMAQTLNSLGYESGQAALEEMNLGEAMLATMNEAEKNGSTVNDLFGNVRALKAVLALTGDEAQGFSEDLKLMQQASEGSGATMEAFEQQSKGAAFQAKIFQNNITAIGLQLRTVLLPAINSAMQAVIPFLEKFANFAQEHPKILAGVLGISAGMTGLGIAMIALGSIISNTVTVFSAIGKVVPIIFKLGSAFKAVGALMLANPILLVIAGIVTAITLLALAWKNNWFDIRGKTSAVINWLGEKFNQLNNWFNEKIIQPAIQIKDTFVSVFEWIGSVVQGFWDLFVNRDFTGEFGRALGISEDSPIISTLLMIRDVIAGFFEWHISVWRTTSAVILSVLSVIAMVIFNTFSFIFAVIQAITLALWEWLVTQWNLIVESITTVMLFLQEQLTLAWQAISTTIMSVVTPIIEFLRQKWEQFKNHILTIYESVKTMVLTAWNWIKSIIISIVTPLVLWLLEKWTTFKNQLMAIYELIKNKIEATWNDIKSRIQTITDQTINPLIQKWENFKNNIFEKAEAIWNKVKEMADNIMSALKSIKFPHLSIGEGSVTVAGKEVKYPKLDVQWYEQGGWVDRTGLAVVHQGEFVLSKNMLNGQQSIPSNVVNTNNSYSNPINLTAIIRHEADMYALAGVIGQEVNSGRY